MYVEILSPKIDMNIKNSFRDRCVFADDSLRVLLHVRTWRKPRAFFENAGEIRNVGEADHDGDFRKVIMHLRAFAYQFFGIVDA